MISFASMWAVTLRHIRMARRDPNFLLSIFYWPLLDVFIWGFVGAWIAQSQPTQFANYESIALLGVLLWQVTGRGCTILITSFAEELWSHNLLNLFSLPLHLIEWMGGAILFTAIMAGLTSLVCMLAIFALYSVSLWQILTTFLIFVIPLFISCIWIGFTGLQIIVIMGKRGVELGYVFGWFLLPFSGAYYPIDILPAWAQRVSSFIPMSYVFEGMREYVAYQQDPTTNLLKGTILSVIYAALAIVLFMHCFNKSKQKGLARLAD